MRIGIDARFYGPIGKGLGRYTQKLIENLERIDRNNQYFVFLRRHNFDDYVPQNSNFQKVLADYQWYTLSEQIRFPKLLNSYKLDLVHFPHFNVPIFYFKKFIVTIHDLILLHFPTRRSSTLGPFLYAIKFWAYKLVIHSAIKRSNRIITVSEFTKNDILENYPYIPQEKIVVTYEACEEYCMVSPKKDKEILARYGIIKPYLLYVGNAYPHKNLERLILAFEKIKKGKKDLSLILVGNEDYFYRRLQKLVQEKNIPAVNFPGYVPDHELDILFHNALAFVWPSLYEGFGLPPLEAMASGTPVISSNHPCMKEILSDSACYFDGKNVSDIVKVMNKVISNEKICSNLVRKGYECVKKYSWKKTAKATLHIYVKIAG